MAIKDMTNNHSNPTAGMRRLALVKKGEYNGTRPIDLDHFRIVWADNDKEADPDLDLVRDVFYSLYGEEPTRFDNAFFLIDDPEDAFWYEDWIKAGGAGKLVRRCDGETQVARYDFNNNRMLHNPIACIQGQQEGCNCKAVGRLSFILKDVSNRTGVIGYFQLQLGGKHEIANISAHLQGIERMVKRPLFTIPFSIFRQDVPVNVPGMIKRVDKSLVHIQADPQSIKNALQLGIEKLEEILEIHAGELPLEISDMIEGEIADFASRLSAKRPSSLLEEAESISLPPRPFPSMDMLFLYLRHEAKNNGESDDVVSDGQAINIGKELSMLFRNNDIRAFLFRVAFGIVPDKEGHLSKYLTQAEFKAIKKWKNLAVITADVLNQEIEMITAAYHAAYPDPLTVE